MSARLKDTEEETKSFANLLRENGFRRIKDISKDEFTDYWEKKVYDKFQIVKFHSNIKKEVHSAIMVGMIDVDDMTRIESNSKYYSRKQLLDRMFADYYSLEQVVFMDGVIVKFKLE